LENDSSNFDRGNNDSDSSAAQRGPGGQGHFQEQDTDGDNLISEQEWLAHQSERFAEIDTDGDGFASEEEMEAHHKSIQRGPKRSRRGGEDN